MTGRPGGTPSSWRHNRGRHRGSWYNRDDYRRAGWTNFWTLGGLLEPVGLVRRWPFYDLALLGLSGQHRPIAWVTPYVGIQLDRHTASVRMERFLLERLLRPPGGLVSV